MNRFVGRTVVVTGAGSGIGRACSVAFGREGAQVFCADIDGASAESVAAGLGGYPVEVDVADEQDVERLASAVRANADGLDVLVNAAGVFEVGSVEDTSLEDWIRQLSVNLTGAFLCSKVLLPRMRQRGRGAIVNLASVAGSVAFPRNVAYSSSKGGLIMLTRSMAIDLADSGIRVNCVCPYAVEGPMMDRFLEGQEDPERARAAIRAATPLRRFATPDEIAAVVLFLASDGASYITGIALPADGGYTAT